MKLLLISLSLFGALLASAGQAAAIIQTSVVLGLGVALPEPPADPEALALKLEGVGLSLLAAPSTIIGDRPPTTSWFAVKRLGAVRVDRDGKQTGGLPVPSTADVEEVAGKLAALGLRGDVKLWLVTQQTGGR